MDLAITPRHLNISEGEFFAISKKYIEYWGKYGYNLYMIPMDCDIEDFFDKLHIKGVLLAGGYKFYDDVIKEFEHKIIDIALKKDIPIFGVCCGMWSINSYFGGNLKFNEAHGKRNVKFIIKTCLYILVGKEYAPIHSVNYLNDGKMVEVIVNSHHRKVIDKLGKGLTPFMFLGDGTIEGIKHQTNKIIGVQFHFEGKGCDKWMEEEYMRLVGDMIGKDE